MAMAATTTPIMAVTDLLPMRLTVRVDLLHSSPNTTWLSCISRYLATILSHVLLDPPLCEAGVTSKNEESGCRSI